LQKIVFPFSYKYVLGLRQNTKIYLYEKGEANMSKNKQSIEFYNKDLFFDIDDVVSATECTGLIPTPPRSESEAESYTDIYLVPCPENNKPNHLQQENKSRFRKSSNNPHV
jgi:hypothetical protein